MTNLILSICIPALIAIESGGNPNAIGDGGRAVGILQMWPVAVQEANRIAGTERWTVEDRHNEQASRDMCFVTLAFHYRRGTTNAVDLCCKWRNPYSKCPQWYRDKVTQAINNRR